MNAMWWLSHLAWIGSFLLATLLLAHVIHQRRPPSLFDDRRTGKGENRISSESRTKEVRQLKRGCACLIGFDTSSNAPHPPSASSSSKHYHPQQRHHQGATNIVITGKHLSFAIVSASNEVLINVTYYPQPTRYRIDLLRQ
ncbi:MAG TPA: hypothetical protein ENJ07_03290 [Gammaproteobacteria bacterium]|nr:hypothetical protein [Gammaproteobacteria bacterium]